MDTSIEVLSASRLAYVTIAIVRMASVKLYICKSIFLMYLQTYFYVFTLHYNLLF